tara:strand:+ start:7419 stop:7838 length:420 start_codon:yes stop_codon:yes gene_type:complete
MSENGLGAGKLEDYSVDQLAGALVLIMGAIGSLLLVIWQSKCHCRMNLCYIFQCERRPPSEDEMIGLQAQAKELKDKANKNDKKQNKIIKKEDDILDKEDILLKQLDKTVDKTVDLEVDLEEQIVPTPKKVKELNLESA